MQQIHSMEPTSPRPGPTDFQLITLNGFRIEALQREVGSLEHTMTLGSVGFMVLIVISCFIIRRK